MVAPTTDEEQQAEAERRRRRALLLALLAGNWLALTSASTEAVAARARSLRALVPDDVWQAALSAAAQGLVTRARGYAAAHPEFTGDARARYLGLVAAAELQRAVADATERLMRVARTQVRRRTHPEATASGPCQRCLELEGVHPPDFPDLYWMHPFCVCSWEPAVAPFAKMSKARANYETVASDGISQCRVCVNFDPPDACGIVAGHIDHAGWCRFHRFVWAA
jgi:hypothetical protein